MVQEIETERFEMLVVKQWIGTPNIPNFVVVEQYPEIWN